MLTTKTVSPASLKIGVAFTRDQRCLPLALSCNRMTTTTGFSPDSTAVAGNRAAGKGSSSSSNISNLSITLSRGAFSSASTDTKPNMSAAAWFAKTSWPEVFSTRIALPTPWRTDCSSSAVCLSSASASLTWV